MLLLDNPIELIIEKINLVCNHDLLQQIDKETVVRRLMKSGFFKILEESFELARQTVA